jgi:beta-1,4-mannosyltransferase
LVAVAVGLVRVLVQSVQLLHAVLARAPFVPGCILVQNPPSVPTLAVCAVAARLCGARLVIDWHNLGYTLLGMQFGAQHVVVRVARVFERVFGSLADESFCVTAAMQRFLEDKWHTKAHVLHDCPPARFTRLSAPERLAFLRRMSVQLPALASVVEDLSSETGQRRRTALVVSSTSWTEDEDFGILLEVRCVRRVELLGGDECSCGFCYAAQALVAYDAAGESDSVLPRLVCVITGKGPMRDMYLARVQQLRLQRVVVVSAWLEPGDYPALLGAADLGVCLHVSSSSLDLPMKVVDMFGCGLPVCAVDYACLGELVVHGKNGLVFQSGPQLGAQLERVFGERNWRQLRSLADGAAGAFVDRWTARWTRVAQPVLAAA